MKSREGCHNIRGDKRPVAFWDIRVGDRASEHSVLRHVGDALIVSSTLDEAVGEYLEHDLALGWPETVTVTGYARQVVEDPTLYSAGDLLEAYVEGLHEVYGYDPDFSSAWGLASDDELVAVLDVLRAIHDRFEPCLCDPVTSEVVDVEAWIRKHRPHWLEETRDYVQDLDATYRGGE